MEDRKSKPDLFPPSEINTNLENIQAISGPSEEVLLERLYSWLAEWMSMVKGLDLVEYFERAAKEDIKGDSVNEPILARIWGRELNSSENTHQDYLRAYLGVCLDKAHQGRRVLDTSEDTLEKLAIPLCAGQEALLFFINKCPHDKKAFLRGEIPPYPWRTQKLVDSVSTEITGKKKKTTKRRRKQKEKVRPLTEKQTEAVHVVGECKGNIAEAARRVGICYRSMKERYDVAMNKLGAAGIKQPVKASTQNIPTDKRGQVNISKDNRL